MKTERDLQIAKWEAHEAAHKTYAMWKVEFLGDRVMEKQQREIQAEKAAGVQPAGDFMRGKGAGY